MGRQEQRAWTMAGVSALAYAGYLAVVFHRARGGSLAEASYVAPLLWAVGAAVLATILADMALGMISRQSHRSDQRDREIHRFGEYVGHSFIVLGGVTALVLAMTEQHPFWVANALTLGFFLSAALSSIAKIVAYRRGLPGW